MTKLSNDSNRQLKHEYKKNVKMVWRTMLVLVPVIFVLSIVFAALHIPMWLNILMNVVVGGFVCLIVYVIYDRMEKKRKVDDLTKEEDYDPFKD